MSINQLLKELESLGYYCYQKNGVEATMSLDDFDQLWNFARKRWKN